MGLAAFVILTEPFGDQIDRVMAYEDADRKLPAIVLPHPMQNLKDAELDDRALLLADKIEKALRGEWDN
jgi:hypothetical protein